MNPSRRITIAIITFTLLVNLCNLCRHIIEIPDRPVAAVVLATFSWVGALVALWALQLGREALWIRQATAAGPPRVWTWPSGEHVGTPTQLPVVSMGIDPLGSPAWRVPTMLSVDDVLMVEGLTPHAAIYVFVDNDDGRAVLRLTDRH